MQNVAKIEAHNSQPHKTYSMGVNQFADWSFHEFQAIHLNLNLEVVPTVDSESSLKCYQSIDWEQEKKVSPVKNQGRCGSSWAFGSVGSIEGRIMINQSMEGNLSISVQELLECSL